MDSFDFFFVKEKPFESVRIVIKNRREGIFGDFEGSQPDFAFDHFGPRVREGDFSVTEGFYFGSQKFDSTFVGLVHGIVVPRLPVLRDNFYSLSHEFTF